MDAQTDLHLHCMHMSTCAGYRFICTMNHPRFIVTIQKEEIVSIQRFNPLLHIIITPFDAFEISCI